MDSLNNNIIIAINNGWFLNISFSNYIKIVDILLPRKNFINIEVISSGLNLIEKLEINENTLVSDIYKEIWKKIKSKYYIELYEDNKEKCSIEYSQEKFCKVKTLYVNILNHNYDQWMCIKTFQGHSEIVNSVAVSPDGRTVVSGSYDNTLKLWSVSLGECLKTFQGYTQGVYSVAFSPDRRTVVSGSLDKTLKLWGVSQ
jgi:WD40 repeat protein